VQPSERKLYIQVLGQMLIADGVLADPERVYLDKVMDGLGMPPDERKAALSGISLDSPIEERIAGLGESGKAKLREEVARVLATDLERSETALLERVRAALG
jgi:hypothetical protein